MAATRQLGRSGLHIAPFALGGNVFGWTAGERASFEVLDAFVAAGFNFIDTADAYSSWVPGHKGGESEEVLGRWMKSRGNRGKVMIATKLGVEVVPGESGLSRAYMQKAVERSLKRLDTDYIDLYQSHRDDPDTPIEETLEAYQQLIKAGKVRAIGASNFTPARLEESLKVSAAKGLPRYESLQPWYNLHDRAQFEEPAGNSLAEVCKREGLGVVSYFSLASGFLTGKYRSEKDAAGSERGYRVKDMLNERGFRILGALDSVAKNLNATPAQVSLAWLLAKGVTAPIASATSAKQLQELLKAVDLNLDSPAVALLDEASAGDAVDRPRAPPPRKAD
ncbi:MAG: aldo/keto reductase [Gammaproteobacteria bacterium]